MNTKDLIATVVGIVVAATLVVLAGYGMYTTGQKNRQKVEYLTTLCIEQGHTGWDNFYGCIGGTPAGAR